MVDINKVASRNLNLFESLCNKIACLVYSRSDGDKKTLNQIIDDLNELDYNLFCVKKERGVLVINQCCYLIPSDEIALVSKAVSLFTNLITKAQIVVEGKTLSLAICWCLECLKHGNQLNILKCIQALVKGNGKKIEEDCQQAVTEIKKLSNKFNFVPENEELCLNCLRCLEAMTIPSEANDEKLPEESSITCFEIFKDVLFREKNGPIGNEVIFCKFLITAMRGIENIIQISDQILDTELGNILGIVKGYMLYGLPGYEKYKVQKIFPSSTTIPEVLRSSHPVRKLRGKYDRKSKKVAVSSITSVEEVEDTEASNDYIGFSETTHQNESLVAYKTSDSDFSDSEFNQNTKIKYYGGKVRHCALILLGKVVHKAHPKVFISYLPSFLPDSSQFPHVRTLITCLLNDPSPKCRSEVLGVLLMIISNSRHYFLQADGISKSSFIAFSCTISNIIKELHRCLILTLVSEKNNAIIKRTLKCISDLIRCSPYHKMEPGLITKIAQHVRPFLKHKDVNIQIFVLTVFGCIVSVEPKLQEVRDAIIASHQNIEEHCKNEENDSVDMSEAAADDFDFCDEDIDMKTVKEKPWLFEQCLQNLTNENKHCDSNTNAALQVESLQVVGALVRNFFREILCSFPNDVVHLLKYCSTKSGYSIRLYSGKLLETVFNSLQFSFCHEDESKRPSIPLVSLLWNELLPGPVTSLIQSPEEPMLRCTGCDCIANVGVQIQNGPMSSVQNSLIFDQLPRDKQIMCITLLFGCIRDESPAVRSSAARAMAILVLFASLREDSLFLLDVIDVTIVAAKDEHNVVRTQASWLLGNLSEAIVLNKQNNIEDGVSPDVLTKLLQTGIKLSSDTPKMKPGALRGVGNLLQITDDFFLKKYKDLVVDGLEALIKNATTGTFMKARWNSCYAIANMLQNPLIHSNCEWTSKIFNVMTNLVQHYKNFKVRISAAFALGVPPTRESYGDQYNHVLSAILNGLENSKNISDFNEYQHRDQLVDQLCLVLCHLVNLIVPSDLISLQDILYFHLDNLSHFMIKFQERLVPEKSNVLLNARCKLNLLMDEKLTVEERSVIRVLENLLSNDN